MKLSSVLTTLLAILGLAYSSGFAPLLVEQIGSRSSTLPLEVTVSNAPPAEYVWTFSLEHENLRQIGLPNETERLAVDILYLGKSGAVRENAALNCSCNSSYVANIIHTSTSISILEIKICRSAPDTVILRAYIGDTVLVPSILMNLESVATTTEAETETEPTTIEMTSETSTESTTIITNDIGSNLQHNTKRDTTDNIVLGWAVTATLIAVILMIVVGILLRYACRQSHSPKSYDTELYRTTSQHSPEHLDTDNHPCDAPQLNDSVASSSHDHDQSQVAIVIDDPA